jgi:hypothetical protein
MLKSSRELVKFSESTRSGLKVECIQDDRCFAAVFSARGAATLENFVLRGTALQGENPKANLWWLCMAMAAS